MTKRLRRGNLQVSETLANFIENEALPDTKISSDMFWVSNLVFPQYITINLLSIAICVAAKPMPFA